MATTRLMALHVNKKKNASLSIAERLSYAMNPQKTDGGALVTAYGCEPEIAIAQFEAMRRDYLIRTGRYRADEVIGYQLRQSFKPGEVTPEEAYQIGCELAQRFLKGKHAYVVATHTDTKHIHNHIIFCSIALDCMRKFRNFLGSGKALGRLSDQICLEHRLSVIENPRPRDSSYTRWSDTEPKPTNRDLLRIAIDDALKKKPDGFEALMKLLEEAGIRIKRGKQISLCALDGKRYARLDTLGAAYSEQALRDVLDGKRQHTPQPTRRILKQRKVSLIIDIQQKLEQGKGKGYERWAKVFNVKQLASSMAYLSSHGIDTYEELSARVDAAVSQNDDLLEKMNAEEERLQEIAELKKAIHTYLKTKDVYAQWKKSGWSKSFFAAHEQELTAHKSAKQTFDKIDGKLPTLKELSAEYSEVLAKKQQHFADYRANRDAMRELLTVKANVDIATGRENTHKKNERIQQR